ncbi:hypothetical protein M5D96_010151 [Drosophila gunungcola]|uniref:C2H2-type domain-containing protein n=1 Tax=Drosophila gunungcola TaxID=103775 RepID=A0A9P9YHC6_9MUSC|nr:hypothetical protein M5D96_010151 [Drosophila gunungcola]
MEMGGFKRKLVDQSLNLLDSLNTALRCDAIQFLLQTLKCKYPEACDQVVRNLFSHIAANDNGGAGGGGGVGGARAQQLELARTKQLQLLLTAKKEKKEPGTGCEAEIKRENDDEEAGSTDLNQNFEKILCKEEFLCLEEEEEDFLDDADTQNSSSLQFHAGNNVDALALGPGDPLDLIQTGVSLLVKRKYAATFVDEDQLGEDEEANSNSSDGKLVKRKRTNNMHLTVTSVRRKEEHSRLGEGYVFHEDSQYTMRYHHSTGEFSERAFKAQLRALLRLALSQHHKPFLRQFYENFVVNGRLLGTTPSARLSSAAQEIMKFEEFIDEGVGAGRLIDALAALSNLGDTPPVSGQLNSSLELDDNDLSPDEDDDDLDHDMDELDAAKQQLIDGGSSSSTSLQAPPSQHGSGSGGSGGQTPGSKKDKPSYNCLLCPKSYRKRKSLLDHYKMHPGYCHDCGQRNGNTLEEIIHHNRTMHVKEFPFVCETCGESYSRKQQFHAHVESHNKKEIKTFPCGECGLKFPQKKLQQHFEETGHKADGAICEVCGEEFQSKNALYQHIIRVHKRDNFFECHICHNRFTLKANLERHVQLHTEIKRPYVCDLCGSSYFTYPALKEHYSNAHVDVSECKCTLCGKRFGSAKSLQRHLPSHSEERPHCCNYCDQTFKWKTHLVRHKQTMHGNEPPPPKKGKQRFPKTNEEGEMGSLPDMPGPPPVKATKKAVTSKAKAQAAAAAAAAASSQQQQPEGRRGHAHAATASLDDSGLPAAGSVQRGHGQ